MRNRRKVAMASRVTRMISYRDERVIAIDWQLNLDLVLNGGASALILAHAA
jgi:hypothetical protein